jgi:hypothetical protein
MELRMNYGFIVVHPDKPCEILQFFGYDEKPNQRDEALLRIELRDDPAFGLQDIWDKVDILEATEEQVKEYQDAFITNSERESA